ncbi:DUF1772 domain-containing protein [Nonomuraea sp. NPDC059194]|uniref:anthrone oxygenase family protein n=1 Tax=Nonomuraea sp. NPDC059194 TaxID=3346764 RepID=UPI00367FACF4
MMDVLRTLALIAATLSMGTVSSAFALYAHTVMPGLRRTDDRTFVGAFQALDRAIINPWFIGGGFLGALLFTIAAAATHLGRPAFLWIVVALVLYVVTVVITIAVNVPRNDAIKAAGDPGQIDVAAVRQRFDEARWATFNLVRVVTSVPAFALLVWALVLHGRSSA